LRDEINRVACGADAKGEQEAADVEAGDRGVGRAKAKGGEQSGTGERSDGAC
jgi:hypothetical protein